MILTLSRRSVTPFLCAVPPCLAAKQFQLMEDQCSVWRNKSMFHSLVNDFGSWINRPISGSNFWIPLACFVWNEHSINIFYLPKLHLWMQKSCDCLFACFHLSHKGQHEDQSLIIEVVSCWEMLHLWPGVYYFSRLFGSQTVATCNENIDL